VTLEVISNQQIEGHKPYCFVIYSDNILEGTTAAELLCESNKLLEIIAVSYEPIDQPIYLFKERGKDVYICIKIAGKYENWDLPSNVQETISFIDKPDFVIVDTSNGEEIFVGETTGTANVGNSQWQREGRKISAGVKMIPMVYQTYYSGTDRSMFTKEIIDSGAEMGQVREPTSIQVINHFIYSLRYKTPSLVIYYPNPECDSIKGFQRDNEGKALFGNYVSVCLLYTIDKSYKSIKKEIETEIYKRMLDFITETVKHRNLETKRIDKDFPVQPANGILKNSGRPFIDFLVNYINGDSQFDDTYDITRWDFKTFKPWSHMYGKTYLLSYLRNKITMYSYMKGPTKSGFTLDTPKLTDLLDNLFPNDKGKFAQRLDAKLPTLIIPTLMFQKEGDRYIYKVDPGTGEIVAFAELFSKDVQGNKTMNTLIYVHVPGPEEFSTATKLCRAYNRYADCLIINGQVYDL